ncbi:MAG: sigma-70 family RNA polymerase sigma factor [Cyanobacteria bacterium SIG26]|nr:sigma-70 family RNA polymerase sigma factor [Cyanobacteria bacterium SIG26]
MTKLNISELEKLEDLINTYKNETEPKKKHIVYLRLIEETMKLVKKIVISFYPLPGSIPKDDLIQVGAVGMLRAIDSYKTEEKGSFKTYVSKVIKGKIFHYLRDKANIVKPPRETLTNMSKVKEAIDTLSESNTKTPTVEEVARYVNLPFDKVEEIMNIELIKNMISLDQNIYTSEGGETLIDRIQAEEDSNWEENYANKKIIEFAINKLPPADKTAIYLYYIEGESRKDIANVLKVSPTQVSRILKRALNKLYIIIQKELNENIER